MKINTVICDRCKRNTDEDHRRWELTFEGGTMTRYYDLCSSCTKDFDAEFMKAEPKTTNAKT